jgi:hypothetical protein
MVTQYDDKGKIFTQVISKEPVLVSIQTTKNLIRGIIHVRRDSRIKDELNSQEKFVAVTDVTVFNSQDEELYRCEFLVLNVEQIVFVVPEEDNLPKI